MQYYDKVIHQLAFPVWKRWLFLFGHYDKDYHLSKAAHIFNHLVLSARPV
jgi:hypothetical protein